jgi:hypothetical protein
VQQFFAYFLLSGVSSGAGNEWGNNHSCYGFLVELEISAYIWLKIPFKKIRFQQQKKGGCVKTENKFVV